MIRGVADREGEPEAADGAPTRRVIVERRFEIIATILLSVAALATAYSGFQASLWDGIQSSDYSRASAARVEAAQKQAEGNQLRLADLTVFEAYLQADASGETDLANFYRGRFSEEFADAYEAWARLDPSDPDTPRSPFAMSEYSTAADREAADLHALADERFASGEIANDNSDAFTLSTLLFAMVLFFAAISERFEHVPSRSALLGLASLAFVVGAVVTITQPVTTG
jgi:hypothetical protein